MIFEVLVSIVVVFTLYHAMIAVSHLITFRKAINKLPRMPLTSMAQFGMHLFLKSDPKTFLSKLKRIWMDAIKAAKHSGKFFLLFSSPIQTYIFFTHPESAQDFLKNPKNVEKAGILQLWTDWMGDSLPFSKTEKWKTRRRLLTNSFHFDILEKYLDVMNEQSAVFIQRIADMTSQKKSIDIHALLSSLFMDIICETAMGVKVNAQSSKRQPYVEAVTRVARLHQKRLFNPFFWNKYMYKLTPSGREYFKTIDEIHEYTSGIISTRIQQKKAENLAQKPANRLAFLDLLIDARTEDGKGLSSQGIQEEVDGFMFAGHDTGSSATTWAIYLLGRHPAIQDRVVEELDSVFGDDRERPATTDDLKKLTYLEQVIKETMRMYPPAIMITREAVEDCTVQGYTIPKGCQCLIFALVIHHNPEVWPDPDKFDPDRFSKENSEGRNPFAYMPFSAGFRNCIGQRFAYQELKVVLSSFLRNYRVVAHDDPATLPVNVMMVLHPTNPLDMTITRR